MTGTKSLIINQQRKILKNKWNFFHPKACRYKKSHYLCTRNQEITDTQIRIDSLAQQVEHNTFNVGVLGSSPRRITWKSESYTKVALFFYAQIVLVYMVQLNRELNGDQFENLGESFLFCREHSWTFKKELYLYYSLLKLWRRIIY